ncbi:hypothetical protein EX30DRAFT_364802 [Ascodesmis nigricans]|uniref:Uncharacterized protein n=1 Tax=Ascodesmis nigricans TaxID=341454 RepID=A0A4V3SIG6_9PEZI|nr:hypothetical protein EX30DRAFT_364802 [Ascodesmis nigricans]
MFTPDLITFTPPLPLPAAHLRPGPPYPAYEYTSTYSSSSLLPYSSPCPRSRFSAYSSSPADSQEADEEDEAEPQTEVDDDESSPVPHATQQRIQQQQQQQDVVKPEPEQMAPAGVNPVHKNPPRTRAARATKRQPGQPGNRARVHQRRRPYPQWYYPHFPISFERSGARPREAAPRLEQGRVEQVEVEVEMEVVGSSPPLPFCHRDSDTSPLTSRTLLYFAEEGVQEMEDMVDGDVNADDDDDDDDKAHGDDGHSRTQSPGSQPVAMLSGAMGAGCGGGWEESGGMCWGPRGAGAVCG